MTQESANPPCLGHCSAAKQIGISKLRLRSISMKHSPGLLLIAFTRPNSMGGKSISSKENFLVAPVL